MSSSLAVSNEFIKLARQEDNVDLTGRKLQKLVYISHGFNLAVYGKPLLNREDIYAWEYGPVVKVLHNRLRSYSQCKINELLLAPDQADSKEMDLIKAVWDGYGHHSPITLSSINHEINKPWLLTWRDTPFGIISNHLIQAHYRNILKAA
ncbi:MAG: DUF4065 domain-containing protein [Methyloprofundus sp.]|nr:DUF4065 domain-containing protein [Methyloprofundus sp.]